MSSNSVKRIYKYFPTDVFELVFEKKGFCGLKCSLPKDYNDPYELFLSVDRELSPDFLAYYNDLVGELEQKPTTCFSQSPIIAPMWAHYANNHSGFVLEFNADELKKYFEGTSLNRVEYREGPPENLTTQIGMAYHRKKPRDLYFAQSAIYYTAYFSKLTDWEYEKEIRLVCDQDHVENVNGCDILYVPLEFVTNCIVGANYPENMNESSQDFLERNGIDWYQLRVGKSQPAPFMSGLNEGTFIFNGEQVIRVTRSC